MDFSGLSLIKLKTEEMETQVRWPNSRLTILSSDSSPLEGDERETRLLFFGGITKQDNDLVH